MSSVAQLHNAACVVCVLIQEPRLSITDPVMEVMFIQSDFNVHADFGRMIIICLGFALGKGNSNGFLQFIVFSLLQMDRRVSLTDSVKVMVMTFLNMNQEGGARED